MGRGPSYPYVDLEQAVGLARKVYDFAKRSPAPVDSVVKDAWNYSPTSSSGLKVLAALKSFGLIDATSGNNGKAVKITDRAYRILVDDQASEQRKEALRAAVLSPRWYQYCWKIWGSEMPPAMRSNLLFDNGFVESTVDTFIRDYKKSVAFAGLSDLWSVDDSSEKSAEASSVDMPHVQWVPEGSAKQDVAVSTKGAQAVATASPLAFVQQPGGNKMLTEVSVLAEGNVTIQWPATMSAESFEDFKDWLKLLQRKIERGVVKRQKGASGEQQKEADSNT
jgi:hypothetical protein